MIMSLIGTMIEEDALVPGGAIVSKGNDNDSNKENIDIK